MVRNILRATFFALIPSLLAGGTVENMRAFIESKGSDAELLDLGSPMTTAQAAVELMKVPAASIFKSLVLVDEQGRACVVVLTGDAKLDQKAVAKQVGAKKLKFASEEEVLKVTGYPAGGTPPMGHLTPLPVLVDEKVMAFETGFGGGGHPNWLLRVRPKELVRVTGASVAAFSR